MANGRGFYSRKNITLFLSALCVVWSLGFFFIWETDLRSESIVARPDAVVNNGFALVSTNEKHQTHSRRVTRQEDNIDIEQVEAKENNMEELPIAQTEEPTQTHRIDSTLDNLHFEELLRKIVDPVTNSLIVTFTNSGFIELTYNWLAYLKILGLKNYLIVCFDELACKKLMDYGEYNCYYNYSAGPLPTKPEAYGSENYIKLVNWKPKYTLSLIKRGYNILVTDVDTIWKQNPYNYLLQTCDLEIEVDTINYPKIPRNYTLYCMKRNPSVYLSTGVYYMRSNQRTIAFVQSLIAYQSNPNSTFFDQPAFNYVISRQNLTIRALTPLLFPSGHHYFLQKLPQRHHANPIIIHNNVLVNGDEAKRHRFREYHFWIVDPEEYYQGNFITIETQADSCGSVLDDLKNGLAVAKVLNRTLVLPTFHCKVICVCSSRCITRVSHYIQPPCFMSDFFQMDLFGKNFRYREHAFLSHPRAANFTDPENHRRVHISLPNENADNLLRYRSPAIYTPNASATSGWSVFNVSGEGISTLHAKSSNGATEEEIQTYFGRFKDVPLLIFRTMGSRFKGFNDRKEAVDFIDMARESFRFLECSNPHCGRHQV